MLVLSNSEQVFMKHFRRVIIASFVLVHLPAYAACAVGYATLIWGYQALVECIEVPVILLSIFVLTLIETKIESSHLRGDTYLPLTGMKKYADDVAVMSALPLHRSLTKERDEESKTENYSISCDADRQSHKELEYDVELRKKALMSIVNHIKNPERRNSIFSADDDRSLSNCTFFEAEEYESSQRREIKRPVRRAFSFGGLKPIIEEDESLLSESEQSDFKDRRFDESALQPKRRMSFPMRVEELKDVENPIFSEAIDEYRNTLRFQPLDN